jgi:two-component sensor histidine kinase
MGETRFRILLIEDDRVDQMAFKRIVKEKDLPYDYAIAGSVSEAKKILSSETFDAVITDYLLGDGTAFDINGLVAGTPVIFVTGAGDEEIAVKALKAGAYDYLIKDQKHNYLNVLSVTTENVIKRKRMEELVEARTAELIRTNEQLKKEIAERIKKEEQIKAALKEKDVLLREIHHRVKNNLQVIYGLLEMQSSYIKDQQSLDICRSLKNLIITMSLVHKTLYKSKDLSQIDFQDYISDLIKILYESFNVSTDRVALKMNFDDFSFEIKTALPCGLVINELVSNSLKYAFPDNRKGEITISFSSRDKKEFELIVSDNGIGIPEDLDINKAETVGLNMIGFFIKNMLRGKMELKREKGTEIIIKFHVDNDNEAPHHN